MGEEGAAQEGDSMEEEGGQAGWHRRYLSGQTDEARGRERTGGTGRRGLRRARGQLDRHMLNTVIS